MKGSKIQWRNSFKEALKFTSILTGIISLALFEAYFLIKLANLPVITIPECMAFIIIFFIYILPITFLCAIINNYGNK